VHLWKIYRLCACVAALTLVAVAFPAYTQDQQPKPDAAQSLQPDNGQKTSPPAPVSSPDQAQSNAIGVPATVLATDKIEGILGKEVKSHTGESMGRIVDVIVDRSLTVQGVVIDFGGFLGVGSRQIAVAWKALRFSQQNKSNVLIVDFTKDQLKAAPAYKAGEQVVLLHPTATTPTQTNTPPPSVSASPSTQATPPETPAK